MVWQEFVEFINFILNLFYVSNELTQTQTEYVISLLMVVILIVLMYSIKYLITSRLEEKISELNFYVKQKYLKRIISIINSLLSWQIILPTSIYLGTRNLEFTQLQNQVINGVIYAFISIILIKNLFSFYDVVETYYQKKIGEESKQITEFFKLVAKVLTLLSIFLWYLSAINVEITAFLAGFGIAGIVIGLALQEVISDLFASISIYLDQPFEIGDRVEVNGEKGNIEKIGIRSTKIRSLDGHLMVVSNQRLTSQNIKNFKKMERRRAKKLIGVAYETESSVLEEIPVMVEEIFSEIENVTFDRMCIVDLSDFSIDYELMYFVESRKKSVFVHKSHKVFIEILKMFENNGIEIPYPKREIYRPQLQEQRGVKTTKSAVETK